MVIAPSASDLLSSKSWVRSISVTLPIPSQRGHMPPVRVKVCLTVLPAPRSIVIAPLARTEGTLKANALGEPMCGCPSGLKRMRCIALASITVPTVERALAPIRSWSTRIAVVKAVEDIDLGPRQRRHEALQEGAVGLVDQPLRLRGNRVEHQRALARAGAAGHTVSRRFGISTLTSLRLFSRAPCTRIRSWLSATCSAGDCVSVLVAVLIVSPSVRRGRLRGLRWRRLARSNQLRAVRLVLSSVLNQPEDVVRGFLHGGTRGGHLGQLCLDVRHVPVGHRPGHALRSTARRQPHVR